MAQSSQASQLSQPQRLLSNFESCESQKRGWVELWEKDANDLWDRGTPSPALIDWIESRPRHLPRPADGHRLRALVPGCGKGYDVAMLALHGLDVVGLDISPKGAAVARAYAAEELASPHAYNFGRPEAAAEGPGSVTILAGDFFDQGCCDQTFDLIYDYTFLCALHPEMRRNWADRMKELLDPTGVLVCLEFPLFREPEDAGPPWPLQGVYWDLLAVGGDGRRAGEETDEKEDGRFVRVAHFKPPRSYSSGRDTDMVGVWQKKPSA